MSIFKDGDIVSTGNVSISSERLATLERVAKAARLFADGLISAPLDYPGFRVTDHKLCTPLEDNCDWSRFRAALSALNSQGDDS